MDMNEYLTLKALPTEVKIRKTKERLYEWIEYYGEDAVYMSLSGGMGSTVLYWLLLQVNPNVPAVFINNGNEYPEVVRHVYLLKAQNNEKYAKIMRRRTQYHYDWNTCDNIIVRISKKKLHDVIPENGYLAFSKNTSRQIADCRKIIRNDPDGYMENRRFQSMINPANRFSVPYADQYLIYQDEIEISNMCCLETKEKEFRSYEKETGRFYPITGEQAEESRNRREAYLKFGCNGYDRKHPKSTPLGFWTQQDLLWIVKQYRLPYAECYGEIIMDSHGKLTTTGERRTGCICCTAGIKREQRERGMNRFQRMKQEHPKHYAYAMRPLDENGAGMKKLLEVLNIPDSPPIELDIGEMFKFMGI